MIELGIKIRELSGGFATGDQAIFVRRDVFFALGGFPRVPLMEDVALTRKLARIYTPVRPAAHVFTSARRWMRRGVARTIGLVLFAVVCGLEWFLLAVGTATPLYSGPAEAGRTVPAFTSNFADGTPFTEEDLKRGSPTVLLFFRGRW